MNKLYLFLIIILLQISLLTGMVIYFRYELKTGYPVNLGIGIPDYQDPMKENSVRLNYDINRFDLNKIPHDKGNYTKTNILYVSLMRDTVPDSPLWIAKSIHTSLPATSAFPFIKGHGQTQWNSNDTIRIDYDIDRFYVQQGKGVEIANAIHEYSQHSTDRVYVEVSLNRKGNPFIRNLYLKGKPFSSE